MQPTAQTQDDWKKAIEFCQVVDNAYHIPPGPTFTVGGTNYKIVANTYANDLATDANQGITDQVTIGLICQTDPGRDVVIAIRGTEGMLEWAHDLNFDKVPCPFLPGAGQTDDGFTEMYNSLTTDPRPDSQSVVKALPTVGFDEPVSSVTICGHSLGGALADAARTGPGRNRRQSGKCGLRTIPQSDRFHIRQPANGGYDVRGNVQPGRAEVEPDRKPFRSRPSPSRHVDGLPACARSVGADSGSTCQI